VSWSFAPAVAGTWILVSWMGAYLLLIALFYPGVLPSAMQP
jgi:hypothetical protein